MTEASGAADWEAAEQWQAPWHPAQPPEQPEQEQPPERLRLRRANTTARMIARETRKVDIKQFLSEGEKPFGEVISAC